jgi:hypothetical protein
MLGGTSPQFYMYVTDTTASQVRLAIYDGVTLTYGDYHTGGGGEELLYVGGVQIADHPTEVAFRIYYDDAATTAYADDGICINAYVKYDYDISDLGLVNNTPEQVFRVSGRSAGNEYPRPSGLSVLVNQWKVLPNGFIRFLENLGSGVRLRIVGKKYLTLTDATAAAVAAGASFLDLNDVTDASYADKAGYAPVVNSTETGMELTAISSAAHAIGGAMHLAGTMAELIAMVSDLTPATTADITTHEDLATGIHGVGASTVASVANITTHAALTTGAHGVTGTVLGTEDIDDTAGGTDGETDMAASSNAFYDHTAATAAHGATGAVMGTTNECTATLKTFTTPVIASIYQDAAKTKLMTLPNTASDTLAAIAATQTFTNKTIQNADMKGTFTATDGDFVLPGFGMADPLKLGDITYWGAAFVPAAVITEDWETSTLFDAAAVTDTKAIWTSPAGCIVLGIKMRLYEKFAGTGLSDMEIEVGIGGGDVDAYLDSSAGMNLFSDDLNSKYFTKGAGFDSASGLLHLATATTFTATATSTGCNLADLTAGTVKFYISYMAYGSSLT